MDKTRLTINFGCITYFILAILIFLVAKIYIPTLSFLWLLLPVGIFGLIYLILLFILLWAISKKLNI